MRLQHSTPIFRRRSVSLLAVTVLLSLVPLMALRVASSIESASWQGLALAGLGVLALAGLFLCWHLDRRTSERLARFESFAESAVDGIIMIDTQGTIEYFNHAAERMFGYQAQELLGQNVRLIVPSPHKQQHDQYLADHLGGAKASIIDLRREVIGLHKDGSTLHVDLHVSDLHVGNQRFFAGILNDITERKQIEAQLDEVRAVAEAANQAKTDFLANMSHEIRTPMTSILGFADNLLDPDLTDEQRADSVDTIRRNGKHLLTIINDILDLTKIESHKLDIERARFSPLRLLAEVQSLMRLRTEEHGLALHFDIVGSLPETIESDQIRLRQILINLIGNAVKFTRKGSVRVVTRFLSDDDVPKIEFSVIDTGIGITDKQMASLFQPFTQADASTTRRFGGTGLGLAISKRLTGMLGGELTAHSKLGEGSTFRATVETGPLTGIPMVDHPGTLAAIDASTSEARRAPTRLGGCRVLLVEDCPDSQRLLSLVLKKSGADVTVADNGQIAVEKVLETMHPERRGNDQGALPFDVILMDMQMPVLDGYAATTVLRDRGYDRPIIALTAHAMAGDREKCLDAGCDNHMTKPIERDALLDWVSRYAEQNQPLGSTLC